MRLLRVLLVLLVLSPVLSLGQTAEVRGFLYEKASGEPVIYTSVYLKGTNYGVSTDVNGYYSITKVPPGDYTLTSTSLSYDTAQERITLTAGQLLTKKLYLEERTTALQEVEITGSKSTYQRQNTVNVSVTQITPRDIKITPNVGGEADLAQFIQTVPGVVSTGDQGGQVYIRGGTLAQNLTLLDGMVIYNPFHSIGIYSIFDPDLLKSADFYTAGFGPEYGGRTSSVIDGKTIDGNKRRHSGRVSVNPVAAKVTLDGPLLKERAEGGASITYLASVRHSYLDKLGPKLYPYASRGAYQLGFGFTDLFGKLTLSAGSGAKVSISAFDFQDRADVSNNNSFNWRNTGAGANFILTPSGSTVLINGTFAYSNYKIQSKGAELAKRESAIGAYNGGLDFTYFIQKSELKYGVGLIGNSTSYTAPLPTREIVSLEANNTELYGYAKYRINTPRLIIDPGLRFHYYASLNRMRLEPRVGAKYLVTDKVRIKAAGGLYSQNLISTRSDRDVVNLFSGFISSPEAVRDGNNKPVDNTLQLATHGVLGVEVELARGVEVDIEGYVKSFSQFINVNFARQSADDPDFIAEKGLARGLDVSIKYEGKGRSLKLTYSLAQVTRTFGNLTYSPTYDRRHNINLLGSITPIASMPSLQIDARFALGTGLPFTQTQGYYESVDFAQGTNSNVGTANGSLQIYYGGLDRYNKGRLPIYHRADVSIKKQFTLSTRVKAEASAGATNFYNRENLFYIDRLNLSRRVNQLPILPFLALSASF